MEVHGINDKVKGHFGYKGRVTVLGEKSLFWVFLGEKSLFWVFLGEKVTVFGQGYLLL